MSDQDSSMLAKLVQEMTAMRIAQERTEARVQAQREEAERLRAEEERRRAEEKAQTDQRFEELINQIHNRRNLNLSDDDDGTSSRSSGSHANRPRYERYDDDRGLKIDLPEFDGSYNPEAFLDWLRAIERIFDYKGYDDEKRCKIATLKLTKHASLWYENLKVKRERARKSKVRSWTKLKKKLTERFLPASYKQERFLQLSDLTQGTKSVQEYHQEFLNNYLACNIEEEEELKITRFLKGLNFNIRRRVELMPYVTFDDVIQGAHKVERQEKCSQEYSRDQAKVTTTIGHVLKVVYLFKNPQT